MVSSNVADRRFSSLYEGMMMLSDLVAGSKKEGGFGCDGKEGIYDRRQKDKNIWSTSNRR